jgi:hypothetical protein
MRLQPYVQRIGKYLDGGRRTRFRLAIAAATMSLAAWVCVNGSQDQTRVSAIGGQSRSVDPSAKVLPSMPDTQAPGAASSNDLAKARESLGRLPMTFEANQGQTDSNVRFLAHGSGYSLALTPNEAVLSLQRPVKSRPGTDSETSASAPAVVHMQLLGANTATQVVGLDKLPGKVNYYRGKDPSQWQSNIPTYARVEYQSVYPGIDLVYHGNERQLEYDFIVAPGADVRTITLSFTGADQVDIDAQGDLVLRTAGGDIHQHKPVLYQEVGGARQEIAGHFVLRGTHQVGFEVGDYDLSRPLVIDPVISYASYFGGTGEDVGRAIAMDAFSNVYIVGYTNSPPSSLPGPPTTVVAPGGNFDVFVTQLSPAGGAVLWTTILGSSGDDFGYGIAVDPVSLDVYITGTTYRVIDDFPTTLGSFLPPWSGGPSDGFAARLNGFTGALMTSTYIYPPVAPSVTAAHGIALGVTNCAFVTGYADVGGGNIDAFVIELDPTLSGVAPGGYFIAFGGAGQDIGYSIAVDPNNTAYVTGSTTSPPGTFTLPAPTVFGPLGGSDVFVSKINAGGSNVWNTFLGSPGGDAGLGIVLDHGLTSVYVTGYAADGFPTTPGSYQTAYGGDVSNAFAASLSAATGAQISTTYLLKYEVGHGISLDPAGNVYVTGHGNVAAGTYYAFVMALNPALAFVAPSAPPPYPSEFGAAAGKTIGYSITVDAAFNVYVTGCTNSAAALPTAAGVQPAYGGGPSDAFLVIF